MSSVDTRIEDLFRREFAHLVSALARLLGPANLTLAEDVVHDALITAMQAWRFGIPEDPKAWLLQVAKRRAIDLLRRERRLRELTCELTPENEVDLALSPEADAENQLSLMFAICDPALSSETHVSLILRLLSGLSAAEIARAFLIDPETVDRRLHRGRKRLQELGELHDVVANDEVRARQPSVEKALYLLFNEGYHGSDPDNPLRPAICADAIRFSEMLLAVEAVDHRTVHALCALFCFHAARLPARLDEDGVIVPLAEQERARWDLGLIDRGIYHLGESATGDGFTRFHLEAGIAFEHTRARSMVATDWATIVAHYDALLAIHQSPIVALNRAVAVAEIRGLDAGREALAALANEPKLASYSFYWAARADIERRADRLDDARMFYQRAVELAKSRAERTSYERRLRAPR